MPHCAFDQAQAPRYTLLLPEITRIDCIPKRKSIRQECMQHKLGNGRKMVSKGVVLEG